MVTFASQTPSIHEEYQGEEWGLVIAGVTASTQEWKVHEC